MALTTNEKQLSNRILNQLDSEKRRRLRKLTDTLEETGSASEIPGYDFKYKWIGPGTSGAPLGVVVTQSGTGAVAGGTSTSLVTRQGAFTLTGSASTTSVGGFQVSTNNGGADLFLRPVSEGGGFRASFVWSGSGFTVASARMFVGYCSRVSGGPFTDLQPSSLVNLFGVACDDSDTELQFIHNDGVGTATKIALGASFPKPSANQEQLYRLLLSSTDGTTINYTLTELVSGATTSGSVDSGLPADTVALGAGGYISAGGTSTTSVFRLHNYTEIQPNVW